MGNTPSFQGTDLNLYPDWLSSPRTIGTQKRSAGGFLFVKESVLPGHPDYCLTRHQLTRCSSYIRRSEAEMSSSGRTACVSAQGFQAPASFGKSSEMRRSKEKVVLECGSIPAMSECTPLHLESDFQFCFWVVFAVLRQKSCVSQANFKSPVKVRPCSWSHTTWDAEAE